MNELPIVHLKEYEKGPEVIVDVPQVTTLLGDMSDVVGGKALMCTNDRGLSLTVSRREDNVIRIINVVKQDKKKFTLNNPKYRKEDRWANAFKAIFSELGKHGYKFSGLNIIFGGVGAGSAPYSITASIFVGVLSLVEKLFSYRFSLEEKFSLCRAASTFSPGHPIRIRDVAVLLRAESGHVYLYDCESGEMEGQVFSLGGCRTYLLNSALPYSVLTPEEEEYRSFALETFQAFQPSLKKGVRFCEYSEKEIRLMVGRLPDAQKRCLLHLHLGTEGASKAFQAIKEHDGKEFGRILSLSGRSNVVNAELSSPELDWIFRRGVEEPSVLGLTLVNVGIASTFLAAVQEVEENPYQKHVEEYERIFGFHSDVRPFVPSGSILLTQE
ncbi:MAG: hypothetical protein KBS81_06595 [Spirochaetales bacterium]|nr:hypothetical protein [Candidatus Physcosoma equi]